MKRVIAVLVFLLVVAGVVFFFGWIQIRVSAGSYGVLFSKTSGWEPDVVEPGTFVWRWQRLIPTNMTLYVYDVGIHTTRVQITGHLPSGQAIDALLDATIAFDYDVRLSITTRLAADALPALARDAGLLPGTLGDFYSGLDTQLSQLTTQSVMSLIETNPGAVSASTAASSVIETVGSAIERSVPSVRIVAITAERIDLPDVDLYQNARTLAASVLEARAEAMREAARKLADVQAQTDQNLTLLERYGEILDKYPVLLDYFRAGQEIGGDPLNLESIIPQQR